MAVTKKDYLWGGGVQDLLLDLIRSQRDASIIQEKTMILYP
ncbi:MAG: hypothetical protein ACP5PV_01370 [Methanothrix sp.]